ncbi:MAG: deoxyguanosinetriphosphate triphosphohydrolase [Patescibacteria group bacterium]
MPIFFKKTSEQSLASYAVKSSRSVGRKYLEKSDDKRLCFQRDKDRIIHSKAFRRLDEKTQVFVSGSGDHYRTRLTHTIEVAQISRDIARRLHLNEDLCEAIALSHDLGHPPFGHAGEEALNEIMNQNGMHFEHNEQSKRVVEKLEKAYPNFDGLNLSFEVLGGLIKHKTSYDQSGKVFEIFPHLEAQVVNIADEIAYTNHDMDDGLRSGILDIRRLGKHMLWKKGEEEVKKKYGEIKDDQVFVLRVISSVMALMIEDFCIQTMKNVGRFKIKSVNDIRGHKGAIGEFSASMQEMLGSLRKFLFENFYLHPEIQAFTLRGERMIKKLFKYYQKNPDKFPKKSLLKKNDNILTAIKDYIAGMTDRFLIQEYKKTLI